MSLAVTVLKNSAVLLLFLLFISCGTKNKEYANNVFPYSQFPQEKELKGEVIELDTALFRPALAQAWRSFLDYNSHNSVLATVTQLGEVVEIYNLKDSTHVIRVGEYDEPEFKVSDGYGIPTGIMGFSDVQVTDDAIYAVFHGTSFKDIARQSGRLSDGGKYIYVFSLKGEPLCKYVLDHYIYGIWVDEVTKTIMATDVNNDQPILKFSFG